MGRLIFQSLSIVLLAGTIGKTIDIQPNAARDDAFFPMQEGSEWVYDTKNKKSGDRFDMHVRIEGPWKEKGQSGMIMTQKDKRGRMREFLLKNENGIFIYKLGLKKSISPEIDTRFTPPVPRVIYPLEEGTHVQWKGDLKAAWIDKKIKFDGKVLGWEEVEVPAGKFNCIKLYYDQYRDAEHVQETAWYAEGVGQVKYDGGEYVKELKSYTVSK